MIEKLPYILIAISILILLILFVDVSTNKLIIKEYTIENNIVKIKPLERGKINQLQLCYFLHICRSLLLPK